MCSEIPPSYLCISLPSFPSPSFSIFIFLFLSLLSFKSLNWNSTIFKILFCYIFLFLYQNIYRCYFIYKELLYYLYLYHIYEIEYLLRAYSSVNIRMLHQNAMYALSWQQRHRQSPWTGLGDDPRGHEDYHSMDDPSGLGLFTKSHRTATRLARDHVYVWRIYRSHRRSERDARWCTSQDVESREKRKHRSKLCLPKLMTPIFSKPNKSNN